MIGIIYLLTIVLLFSLIRIRFPQISRMSKLTAFIILFSFYISYVSIVSIVLDLIHVKTTGLLITFINILCILTILFFTNKNRKDAHLKLNSNFKLKIPDAYAILLTCGMGVYLFLKMYSLDLNINFLTTDPSVHYLFANYFSETGRLLLSVNELSPYAHMSSYPFLSYVNTGIIMSFFESPDIKLGIYLLSNIILYCLIVLTVYELYKNSVKNVGIIQVTIIIAVATFGYNMNSVIFGFTSQMAGIFLVLCFILINDKFEKNILKIVFLSVLLVGVFYAYYYFVPALFLSYVISNIIKNRSYKFKEILNTIFTKEVLIVSSVVAIFGILYLFILNQTVSAGNVSSIAEEGYIYRELYADFKPYLLFMIVSIFFWRKDKRSHTVFVSSIIFVAFTAIIFIAGMFGKASSYYFYKNYYLLDNLFIILYGIGLYHVKEKLKPLYISYLIVVSFLAVQTFIFDKPIQEKNNLFNINMEQNITNMQKFNIDLPRNMKIVFTQDQREFLNYIIENKDKYVDSEGNLPVIGDTLQQLWFYSYTEIWPKYNNPSLSAVYEKTLLDFKLWEKDPDKNPYLIVMDGSRDDWIESQKVDMSLFDVIYETNGAMLLKYRGGL